MELSTEDVLRLNVLLANKPQELPSGTPEGEEAQRRRKTKAKEASRPLAAQGPSRWADRAWTFAAQARNS